MRILRKLRHAWLAGLALLFSVLPTFAEGTPTFTVDTSNASTAVTELKTKIVQFFTNDILVAVMAILGAGVVIWLVLLAWRGIKRYASKAQ